MKPKAYLCKSKQCKLDDIMFIREYVASKGYDVVEFQGGEYNNQLLLKSDVLIVISHTYPIIDNDFYVGKGQYDEIFDFVKDKKEKGKENVYFVSDVHNTSKIKIILFRRYSFGSLIANGDWQKKYGRFGLDIYVELPEICGKSNSNSILMDKSITHPIMKASKLHLAVTRKNHER